VEQQYNTNEKLDTIAERLDDVYSTSLLKYIGKDVEIEKETITVEDGEASDDISFSLDEAAQVEIEIYDSEGNEMRLIEVGECEAGSYQVAWDGKNSDEQIVEDGSYTYEVTLIDDSGTATTLNENRKRITGITFQDGSCCLLAGDHQIDPESVLSVHDPSA
jgi:flagellar basal-body rod modification protein FlgD